MGELAPLPRVLGRLDRAMLVVTAAVDDAAGGCLVGFSTPCSVHPPRMAVFLSRANRTTRLAAYADHLAVHFPAADQRGLAAHFGSRSGDEVDKLRGVAHHRPVAGAVLLTAPPLRFVGRILDRVDGGDHVGFVLAPRHVEGTDDFVPLRFSDVTDLEPGHDP